MLNLLAQANSILTQMATVAGLNQTDLIESIDDVERQPYVLPMAQLLLHQAVPKLPENKISDVNTSWTVIVTARSLLGVKGHLAMIDGLLDVLSGFQPEGTIRPLSPVKIEFLDRVGEQASAYAVTFSTLQRATINWDVRIH